MVVCTDSTNIDRPKLSLEVRMSSENGYISSRNRSRNHDADEQDDNLSAALIAVQKKMKIVDNAGLKKWSNMSRSTDRMSSQKMQS